MHQALAEETEPLARAHLLASLENARLAGEGQGLVCGDTGFRLYFVRVGQRVEIDGGLGAVWQSAAESTPRATAESLLRPTMVDLLDRTNPGDNIGPGTPRVHLRFDDSITGLEIVAAPKGGGPEIFGTFYRMLVPADGVEGIKRFVIDAIRDGCYAGKICPPAIIGVGVGGTADLSMQLAKEAALLRKVGSHNARPDVAALERELLAGCRRLGIGPMGSRGTNCVMGVHIECAMTHTAALPVAVNAQCLVGRRWRAVVDAQGSFSLTGEIEGWYEGA